MEGERVLVAKMDSLIYHYSIEKDMMDVEPRIQIDDHDVQLLLGHMEQDTLNSAGARAVYDHNFDTGAALALFHRPHLPDLNEVAEDGFTTLHLAIGRDRRNVALGILAREDFIQVNAKDHTHRSTALHLDTLLLAEVLIPLVRPSLIAPTSQGFTLSTSTVTSLQCAGSREVAALIRSAEAHHLKKREGKQRISRR